MTDDLISRQAVLDKTIRVNSIWKSITNIEGKNLEEIVLEIPPVNSQPKTGHWIYICNSEVNGLKIVKCSECSKRTYGSGKYCPNCGARMVEPQESEDKE